MLYPLYQQQEEHSCKILYIKLDNHKVLKQSDDRESQDDQLVIEEPWGVANFDPRSMVGRIHEGEHKTLV